MDAASIGANETSYQGNAGLAGGTFGSFQLDTRPLEDLAKYTMLYNKSEYDQRQKDAEAAAKEIADVTSYDLTTSIPKDAKILQDKYDKLTAYVRDNPNALDYRNRKEWEKYKLMRNDLDNDLQGAKVRSTMNALRQAEITSQTNVAEKARLKADLEKEINDTNIRTPLQHSNDFDVIPVAVTAAPVLKIDVTNEGDNTILQRDFALPDMKSLNAQAAASANGLMVDAVDVNSPEFVKKSPEQQRLLLQQQQAQSASGKLEPIESAKVVSSIIEKYKDPTTGVVDIAKLKKENSGNSVLMGVLSQVDAYNQYMTTMQTKIDNGAFQDKVGNKLQFGYGGLDKNDYQPIDLSKGSISPEELLKMRILGKSAGIGYNTTITKTNEAIDKRGQDLSYKEHMASLGLGYAELDFKKLGAGWTKEGNKWVPPTKDATTSTTLGGVVPYWQNYISPQIVSKNLLKDKRVNSDGDVKSHKGDSLPSDFSGDIPVETSDISGLSMALFGEVNATGAQRGYTSDSKSKIRYENGKPIGVVIDGVFYDQNDINSKATKAENKSVSNKFDRTVFDNSGGGSQMQNGGTGKTYKYNGKSVTEQQIKDAASQWGLTPTQYINKFKIQ